ncbi:MAG TPA: hypothetical protein VGC30_16205 [Dokdonella sp.]
MTHPTAGLARMSIHRRSVVRIGSIVTMGRREPSLDAVRACGSRAVRHSVPATTVGLQSLEAAWMLDQ